jgi:hypothetical protein
MPTPSDLLKLQKSVLLLSQAKEQENSGNVAVAIQLYQQAIGTYPLNPAGYEALMALLTRHNDTANSERVLKAIPPALYAGSRKLQFQHALLLIKQARHDDAITLLEKLEGSPELETARIHHLIGNCHNLQQRIDKALAFYQKAYAAGLRTAPFLKDWAGIYHQQGDIANAEKLYAEALRLYPDYEKLQYEYANFLLKAERYEQGFELYHHRWATTGEAHALPNLPVWDGKTRIGSLLVIKEQGLGDQVLYSALLPAMLEKVGKVTAAFDIRLAPLLQRSYPGMEIATQNIPADEVVKKFDAHVTCADMGRFALDAIGWKYGYLKPDQARVGQLREKYRQLFPGKKLIGISWNSKRGTCSELKSTTLQSWRPILETPGCQFISMQYGDVDEELRKIQDSLGITIYRDPDVDSFADIDGLAAQSHALDLVISTSSSTAHVAAATDARTWVILPMGQALLWYWGYRDAETGWYPRTRLFRASAPTDWEPVLGRVAGALSEFLAAR